MQIDGRRRFPDEVFRNAQQSSRGRIFVQGGNIAVDHVAQVIAAVGYRDAVRPQEIPAILEVLLDPEAALVHERVVLRAQQHQVVE